MLEDKIIKNKNIKNQFKNIFNLFDLWVNKLVDNQPEVYFSAKLTTSRNICSSQRKVHNLLVCSVSHSLPSIAKYCLCIDFKFFNLDCIMQVISFGC